MKRSNDTDGSKRREMALSGATWMERKHFSKIDDRREKAKGNQVKKRCDERFDKGNVIQLSDSLSRQSPDVRDYLDAKLKVGIGMAAQGRQGVVYDTRLANEILRKQNPMFARKQSAMESIYDIDESLLPDTQSKHFDHTSPPPPSAASLLGLNGAYALQESPSYARMEGMIFVPMRKLKRDPGAVGLKEPISNDCNLNRIVRCVERDGGCTLFQLHMTLHDAPSWVAERLGVDGSNCDTVLFSLDFIVGQDAQFLARFVYAAAYCRSEKGEGHPKLMKLRELLGDKSEVPSIELTRSEFLNTPQDTRQSVADAVSLSFISFYYHIPHRGHNTLYDKIQEAAMRREQIIVPSDLY